MSAEHSEDGQQAKKRKPPRRNDEEVGQSPFRTDSLMGPNFPVILPPVGCSCAEFCDGTNCSVQQLIHEGVDTDKLANLARYCARQNLLPEGVKPPTP